MAEPYDFLLEKYIETGKNLTTSPNFDVNRGLDIATGLTELNFGDTYTSEEYMQARMDAEQYVLINYANNFSRIPD